MKNRWKVFGKIVVFIIFYFIISTILQAAIIFLQALIINGNISEALSPEFLRNTSSTTNLLLSQIANFAALFISLILFVRVIDHKKISSLGFSFKRRFLDCISGFVLATVIISAGFFIILGIGKIQIEYRQFNAEYIILSFITFILVAISEETLCRGYLLGNLMNVTNKFAALIISSLIFSLLHLFNPNINILSIVNIFLAGIILGASYIYTRNLWFPIFFHLYWNFLQGPIFGFNVSGLNMSQSVFVQNYSVKDIMNGGDFGFEGSVFCSILITLGIILIISYYENKNKKIIHRYDS